MERNIFLVCLCFIILSHFSSAIRTHDFRSNSKSPLEQEAEKLIRQLNLIPHKSIQQVKSDESMVAPRLFEKSFQFPNLVGSSGNTSVEDLGHRAGYYKIRHSIDARMFYFFFESRNDKKKDPVVIWLTGGPGCGSEVALFYENGPFTISNNLSLSWNEYGWDKTSNILFVDQPTGTGFSYSSDETDFRQNETGVSNDLYDFLQAFYEEHPQYENNDFYITGESYAGHYIPALASRIHKGNKAKEGIHINLKGFAIGNGLTNPRVQYKAYGDYALDVGLIKESDYESIKQMIPECEKEAKLCESTGDDTECSTARSRCNSIFQSILNVAGNVNYYDVRKECEGSLCYDFSNMETFLNLESVRKALGVGDIEFASCNSQVYSLMIGDWMKNLEVGIPELLEDGIEALIYAGEYDLICNWLGNWNWVHEMKWSGQQEFTRAANTSFTVDGKDTGLLKSHGPLSFLKVRDAGHMVPMDQPKAALEMLRRWTRGKLNA